MQAQSLGREDPLEEGMATNSSILAWRIPWTEEPGRLQSMGLQNSLARLKQLSMRAQAIRGPRTTKGSRCCGRHKELRRSRDQLLFMFVLRANSIEAYRTFTNTTSSKHEILWYLLTETIYYNGKDTGVYKRRPIPISDLLLNHT